MQLMMWKKPCHNVKLWCGTHHHLHWPSLPKKLGETPGGQTGGSWEAVSSQPKLLALGLDSEKPAAIGSDGRLPDVGFFTTEKPRGDGWWASLPFGAC